METNETINYMDPKEFLEKGYLQEVNRQFFHPLGLALEVKTDPVGNVIGLGGIWDYRDDEEGIIYNYKESDAERIQKARQKEKFIQEELSRRSVARVGKLGYTIEPITESNDA